MFHEYGHGLSWRMIGGMSGPLAGAVGEGNSDGIAMLINGDDRIGEYVSSNPAGIRRYPYAGFPLTYKDVTGAEVHNDGEIYAAIVWRMMELFTDARRADLFRYVVDGMNYTPSTPAYEDMRDGILASVASGPAKSDCSLVWQAFAQFGVGVGASGVVNSNWIFTYNQGTFIGAANCLWKLTGDSTYFNDALKAALYTKNSLCTTEILPGYDYTGDGGGFTGIFARWMSRFMTDNGLENTFYLWLAGNANAAWALYRLAALTGDAPTEEGRTAMEAKAQARFVRVTPQKARRVIDNRKTQEDAP